MKAIVRDRYGSPDVLRLEEIEKPTCGENALLVKVHASSVSASDWEGLKGAPLYARLVGGLRKPRIKILGSDFAGRVEAVGRNVKDFQPGDDVFGDAMWCGASTFAEYVAVPENAPLARKPTSMSFEEAATLPQAAVIALQGIRDKGQVQPGQRVLIVGAGGGSGTFAVQLAKRLGAEVTGVDNTEKLDVMRSVGADHEHSSIARIDMTEKMFRWMLNEDPMATDKLAEGIRNFHKDLTKLEDYVSKFVTETIGVK